MKYCMHLVPIDLIQSFYIHIVVPNMDNCKEPRFHDICFILTTQSPSLSLQKGVTFLKNIFI